MNRMKIHKSQIIAHLLLSEPLAATICIPRLTPDGADRTGRILPASNAVAFRMFRVTRRKASVMFQGVPGRTVAFRGVPKSMSRSKMQNEPSCQNGR